MSRRKRRYENRKKEREEKKSRLKQYDDFENVRCLKSLYNAAKKAALGVSWKASVQRYLLSILFKIQRTKTMLENGEDIRRGFIEFDICERGKTRHIKSVRFEERVVQKTICKNAMFPMLTNNIIFHNYASQKGKGTTFAEEKFIKYLRWHIRHYGVCGYILSIDFKGYFESIYHEPLKENFRKYFTDEKIIKLADDFVDAFGCRGLGLGSETSQINAITNINSIDHFIKETEKIKCYGRYMDDSYIIHPDKEYLKNLLEKLRVMYSNYGIVINNRKTKIISIKRSFVFLKTRFFVTDTGKIVKKPCRESITRERRKLKKQAKLLEKGILSIKEIRQSYQSWRGSMQHRQTGKTIYEMDKLYKKLFERSTNNDKS